MQLPTPKALVVLSGGQDSTTCLFWAVQKFGAENVYALTFDYGQRHAAELRASIIVAGLAGVTARHHSVSLGERVLKSASPLTQLHNRLTQYTDYSSMVEEVGGKVEATFIPLRNMLFLTIACNRAISLDCDRVVIGISEEDSANYPDCTEPFLNSFERTAREASGNPALEITAPLLHSSKAETCQLATTLPGCWEALAYTHTSYAGEFPPTDMNHANILRAHGFEQAGLPDPLWIRAGERGYTLPPTFNYDAVRKAFAARKPADFGSGQWMRILYALTALGGNNERG